MVEKEHFESRLIRTATAIPGKAEQFGVSPEDVSSDLEPSGRPSERDSFCKRHM